MKDMSSFDDSMLQELHDDYVIESERADNVAFPAGAPNSPDATDSFSSYSIATYEEDQDDDIVVLPDNVSLSTTCMKDMVVPENMDALIARQMASLSTEDREKVYFDIHGVSDEVLETPELIESKLDQMAFELLKLPDSKAYEIARAQSSEYVDNANFRLSFLRAELFDATKAAKRFSRHWQAKYELFGEDLLTSDITQDDLDPDTLEALYCGLMQYLPLRDRAGRLVHVSFFHPDEISLQAKLRRVFYMCMASNEDEETQRKGRVAIGYLVGQDVTGSPRNDWQVANLLQALPVRMEAVHLCHDSQTLWGPIFSVFKYVVCLFLRMRIREHFGPHSECLFKLQTFGIPIHNCFPTIRGQGQIDKETHVRFWEKRCRLELFRKQERQKVISNVPPQIDLPLSGSMDTPGAEAVIQRAQTPTILSVEATLSVQQSTRSNEEESAKQDEKVNESKARVVPQSSILVPGIHDVLLGRGKGFYQHKGNIRFRHWIDSRSSEYDEASSSAEKKRITREVIKLVREGGGRFLKDDRKCGWLSVTDEMARQKVAHVFRSLRTPVGAGNSKTSTLGSATRRHMDSESENEGDRKRSRT